jgi:hypothetical protein
MNQSEIEARLREAVNRLYEHDVLLLEYEVGERAVTAKLACYLAPLFPDYDVDVEYNRHGLDPKVLDLPAICHGGGTKLIIPDVIVHRRGRDHDNLLVVEVKKETNTESRDCDRVKIQGMKQHFKYDWGVLIDMPAGLGCRDRQPKMEWL